MVTAWGIGKEGQTVPHVWIELGQRRGGGGREVQRQGEQGYGGQSWSQSQSFWRTAAVCRRREAAAGSGDERCSFDLKAEKSL